ncbi:MAG: hypothetical protein AB1499_03185 [Nitrospirota bacterium]
MKTRSRKKYNILMIFVFLSLFSLTGLEQAQAGWYTATMDNQSNYAWSDFHFEIFAIPGHDGDPMYDITNVMFDVLYNPPTTDHRPLSSQTLDSGNEWNLSGDGRTIDLNFYNDLYAAGETGGWWKVHISNPDGVLHGVATYPSVVPEPVSSVLFIIGSVGLLARYNWKKRKAA